MKRFLLSTLLTSAAFAQGVQNFDFDFLFGAAHANSAIEGQIAPGTGVISVPGGPQILPGTSIVNVSGIPAISASAGFTMQVGFGYQLTSTKTGNLYLEVPSTFVFSDSSTVSTTSVNTLDRHIWYFTPGVRFKVPTGTRFSFYGVLGGGFANFNERDVVLNGQAIAVDSPTFAPALDVGGGIDFRVSRWLSLRAEGRDFVSGSGYGGTTGHNHPVALFGFAFHR
jgi:opacity protein-like surface antigen